VTKQGIKKVITISAAQSGQYRALNAERGSGGLSPRHHGIIGPKKRGEGIGGAKRWSLDRSRKRKKKREESLRRYVRGK